MMEGRHGARQIKRFDPDRASVLDDVGRFAYVDPGRIVALLDIPAGGVVVDFGTGTGLYALEIAQRRPDATVLALDEQPAMLDFLRAKPLANRPNLAAILPGDARLANARVDRILALNVLHELEDRALQSFRGYLSAGGFALVIDWDASADRPVGPPAAHVYTAAEARGRLSDAGYDAEPIPGFPYHHAFLVRSSREAG
jgi:SAM-dependent methyltransferase